MTTMLAPSERRKPQSCLVYVFWQKRVLNLRHIFESVHAMNDLHELHEHRWLHKHMGHKAGEHFDLYEL